MVAGTAVLPVVPDFTHLDVPPDPRVLDAYHDEWTNILFVGRVIPNKRPDNLIRFFHAYKTLFNPKARLLLAGAYGGFDSFLTQLHALVAALGVEDVHILGQVTNEELTALYDVADLFLCASEHEGFCVPLIESFYKRVPVVALAATAVHATMDGGGVLYETTDPEKVAALIHGVVSSADREDDMLARQDAALGRLLGRDFDGLITGFVREVLRSPRLPPPHVAPDFWRQYTLVEELDALHQTRPAAFRALPVSPAESGPIADLSDRR